MSILLKNWTMPPRCVECPCIAISKAKCMSETRYEIYTCKAIDKNLDIVNAMYERDRECPLIEVSDTSK